MKDLTKGMPAKVILLFALPLILGNILQQVYNLADAKIVSEYAGEISFAAIGATMVIVNLMTGFVNGLTQGFGILIARCFGAKDEMRMRKFIAGTVKLTLIVTVLMTVIGELVIHNLLVLLKTPDTILYEAELYIRILIGGFVCSCVYNMLANILRAVGDSKRPLYCLMGAIVINIGLDLLFIPVLHLGIKGAAIATVISQGIAALSVAMIVWKKYRMIIPRRKEWKLDTDQYLNLSVSGLSMGFMNCIVSFGTIILQSGINGLGTNIIQAHTAGRKVFDVLMVMIFTVGIAMTTYVSQNLGAGKIDRVRQGVRQAMIVETVLTTLMILICYTLGGKMVCWLASSSEKEVIEPGVMYIRVGVLFFYVLGPLFVLRCSLQGVGRKIVPVVSSVLELLVKIASVLFLVPRLQYFGVALTEPISWIVMTIWLAVAYIRLDIDNIVKGE